MTVTYSAKEKNLLALQPLVYWGLPGVVSLARWRKGEFPSRALTRQKLCCLATNS